MRDIAFVTKQPSEQIFDQLRNGFAIIDDTGRESQDEQFAVIIEDQMQFDAKEPARRTLASLGEIGKHLVLLDPQVMTHNDGCRIDERDTAALAKTTAAQLGT